MLELLTRCRRDLHQIPELDFDLPETTAYLRRFLEPLPCTLFSPDGRALCAFFDAGQPSALAFRADMDALPIQEVTGAAYASRHSGRMHACGHDGHMAMVLALAELASRYLTELEHNILLVFQPAEETTGGARFICRSGVFAQYHVEAIYGIHLWPDLPAGTLAGRPGPLLARASEVTATFTGKSAHIARWQEGADALMAGARFLTNAAELTERLDREMGPCLLKFGKMESGAARNAVSAHTRLEGSLRVFSDETFDAARAGLEALTAQTCPGVAVQLHFSEGYPPVCNDEGLFRQAEQALPQLRTLDAPLLIAEDFAFYQRTLPGLFLLLGTGTGIPLHSDRFDFDERVLETGLDAYRRLLRLP